jgi:starch synthase
VSTWYDRPSHIAKLIGAAMTRDFSWDASAAAYESAYHRAMANRKKYDERFRKYYR